MRKLLTTKIISFISTSSSSKLVETDDYLDNENVSYDYGKR